MLLNTADRVYVGTTRADAVYLGSELVWAPPPGDWNPGAMSGLVTWLDAGDYTPGSWPNKTEGPPTTVEGPTPMTVSANQLNGMPLVRFTKDQGRLRSVWPYPVHDFTLIYLVRWVGPGIGRAFTARYPTSNFLVGMHTSQPDWMFDNGGDITPGTSWANWNPPPGPWRMYGADDQSGVGSRFFIDGAQLGGTLVNFGADKGLSIGWGISGYEASSAETLDIEVAELVLFNRKLSDAERQQVEAYLQDKWFGAPASPYDTDTDAYLAATGLNVSYAPALDGLVRGLKTHGLWTKMKAIYPFIGGTAELHKWNLKDPRDLDAAYRLTYVQGQGGGSHSTALGYRPNAAGQGLRMDNTGGYADSHLVPLGTLAQNDTHLSLYSLADVPLIARCDMGCYNWNGSQGRFHIIACYLGSAYYYGMSENAGSSVVVPSSSGLFVSTRTAATTQTAYRNGASVASSGTSSVTLPNVPVHLGQINSWPTERSDLPFGFASIGDGLTQADAANLYTVVQDYQTALGRQRSPIE